MSSKFEPLAMQRNLLERVKLSKQLRLLELNQRSASHRALVEQGVLFRRFQRKLMQSEQRKNSGGKFRSVRSTEGPRLNTQAGAEDAELMSQLQRVSHGTASRLPTASHSKRDHELSAAEVNGRRLLKGFFDEIPDTLSSSDDDEEKTVVTAQPSVPTIRSQTAPPTSVPLYITTCEADEDVVRLDTGSKISSSVVQTEWWLSLTLKNTVEQISAAKQHKQSRCQNLYQIARQNFPVKTQNSIDLLQQLALFQTPKLSLHEYNQLQQ